MGDSNIKPTLPWDIIDAIVAGIYHEGDAVTLRCCSLTSPDLRGKCQALIFSKISLVSEEQTHKFASLLDHNTLLATYPRELKLGIPTSQYDPSYLNRLASTLFYLSNIQILRITSMNQTVYWNSIEGRLRLSIEHLIKSQHLTKLSLLFRCVRMALPALLYHSSNLRQLTISALDDLNMDTSSCQDAHRSVVPHLQYLEMKASQGMYKLLEAKGPDTHSILHCHSLVVLIITLDGEDGLGCVERILPTFLGLEYLRFNVYRPMSFHRLFRCISPSSLQTIRTMALSVDTASDGFENPLRGLCEEFFTLPVDNVIRHISINLVAHRDCQPRDEHWSPLNIIFTPRRFPSLQSLSITVATFAMTHEGFAVLNGQFMEMAQRCFPSIKGIYGERFVFSIRSYRSSMRR